jgi:hypothetical protein
MSAYRRLGSRIVAAAVLLGALSASGCGSGGGSGSAKNMSLTGFFFTDRALVPQFPTGAKELPRNAEVVFQFSELVDPASVDTQSIAIRYGDRFQSVPTGSFLVDGARVIFDPTVTQQGTPNPFGFPAGAQFNVLLPGQADTPVGDAIVRNLDDDPLVTSFFTNFTTGDGYLQELVPPQVLDIEFIPTPDPLTKQIPGNGLMAIRFSEPMDPASFVLGATFPALEPGETVDVRYVDQSPNPNVNTDGTPAAPTGAGVYGQELQPIPGTFESDPSATIWYFRPTFSFGDKKYVFSVALSQFLRDLAGNLLVNPRSFGPYTCDGQGRPIGRSLVESFDNVVNRDGGVTSADWGQTVAGRLQGAAITTRRAYIACWQLSDQYGGAYNPIVDPLMGATLNQQPGIGTVTPPTNQGRRVMWAFEDREMGASGTITAASWGPDSNATYAAYYPDVILRIGFQRSHSMNLATTFSGNYEGSPLIIYKGPYSVQQAANVGDEYPKPTNNSGIGANQPLYDFTGFVNWPALTSYFDWDAGDASVIGDSVLVFDASVQEGDAFQQLRGWFGVAAGFLIPGFPLRRMYATYEEDVPNPQGNGATIANPEPSLTDTAFTITKRVSIAQTLFYTPDNPGVDGISYAGPQSSLRTFATKSDYLPAVITPSVQSGGATILMQYQGATALDPTGVRNRINQAFPFTPFTTDVDDCDTYPYVRWRMTLTSNLNFNAVAKVDKVILPIVRIP